MISGSSMRATMRVSRFTVLAGGPQVTGVGDVNPEAVPGGRRPRVSPEVPLYGSLNPNPGEC